MIALESLLTRQGDKYTDAIPERIEAFLGGWDSGPSGNTRKEFERLTKHDASWCMREIRAVLQKRWFDSLTTLCSISSST